MTTAGTPGQAVEVITTKSAKYAEPVRFSAGGSVVTLSPQMAQYMFCPEAEPVEAYAFVQFCAAAGLNPYVNEAYLIKYQRGRRASVVIGKDAHVRRMESHPMLEWWDAGLILRRKGDVIEPSGMFMLEADELLGGWCEIKRRDRPRSRRLPIMFKEFNRGGKEHANVWDTMPALMMRKAAIKAAAKEEFPDMFATAEALRERFGLGRAEESEDGGRAVVEGQEVRLPLAPAQDAVHEPPLFPEDSTATEEPVRVRSADVSSSLATNEQPKPARRPDPEIRGLAALYAAAKEWWGWDKARVLREAGVADEADIFDPAQVWQACRAIAEPQ